MAATANLNLTKIEQTDYLSSYPTTHNANMDAIDEAITDNADEFAAYTVKTDQKISNIENEIGQLKPEGTLTLLDAYPIGSIYMSVNSTSPADLFGGTWEEIAGGRVLMGQNSTYAAGSTGGATTHTHTGPAHTHTMAHTHTGPAHTHTGPAHTHVYGARFGNYYGQIIASDSTGGLFELWNGSTSAWVTSKTGSGTGNTGSCKVNTGLNAASATKTTTRPNLTTYTSSSGTGNTGSSGTGNTGEASNSTTSSSGTGNTGSASSLMPYLSVYMWKRTA